MKGIGLVFAGGGGKGSYEIGVWKYIHEIGLDQYVRAVSGTSVGALNAALFVGSSFEIAEELWLNINKQKILTPRKVSSADIFKWLVANGVSVSKSVSIGISKVVSDAVVETDKIAQMILTSVTDNHMFSRDGLQEMISDGLNFSKLQTSEISCFITCVRCSGLKIERFKLNEFSDKEIENLLLASSAIPIVFPNQEFKKRKYCDGGIPIFGDNIPIKPVYDTSVEYIIVVHLNQEAIIDRAIYPNAKIIEIVPKEDLGNLLNGTLDFSKEGATARIQLGYLDAKKVMQPMVDMIAMSAENQKMLKIAQQKNIEFERKRYELLKQEEEIKEKMSKDEIDKLFTELTKER